MATTHLTIRADSSELVASIDALTGYSILFGDAAQQRIRGFLDSLDSLNKLVAVDQNVLATGRAGETFIVFKPSDCFLEFLAALATEFDLNAVEQSGHGSPLPLDNLTNIKRCGEKSNA